MTTKTEIRRFMRDARESFREGPASARRTPLRRRAEEWATQAAGCAGEVENLVQQYVDEHGPNYRSSGGK